MSLNDANQLLKIYQSTRVQWEAMSSRKIASASLKHLKKASQDPDPNVRILASRLMAELGDYQAIDTLVHLLDDDVQNTYSGILQCEDDETIFVGATAAETLVRLGYAPDIESVYERARHKNVLSPDYPVLHNRY